MDNKFWSFVDKSIDETSCWLWNGSKLKSGYGTYYHEGKKQLAHRLAYETENEPISHGMFVCHKCDNPSCVNPSHLFLGTHKDNMRDMHEKHRGKTGEQSNFAKLTEQEVREIYERYKNNGDSQSILAKEYNVTHGLISAIVLGTVWKHLGLEHIPRTRKGGGKPGEDCGHAKLTTEIVISIRKEYESGKKTNQLAKKYNVTHGSISMIVNRKTWKHI